MSILDEGLSKGVRRGEVVGTAEDFEAKFKALSAVDQETLKAALQKTRTDEMTRPLESGLVEVDSEGEVEFSIPIIPGLFHIKVKRTDLRKIWNFLFGSE